MEKQKKWQLYLILAVLLLTVYNILPTIFFYTKPLKNPIGEMEGMQVAQAITKRVNSLEEFTLSWLRSQCKNLKLKPVDISLDIKDPKLAHVTFRNGKDAAFFAKTLQRAGALIPFVPAQLVPDPRSFNEDATTVTVQRHIGIHFDEQDPSAYFRTIAKMTKEGQVTPEYRELIDERFTAVATGFGGLSPTGRTLLAIKTGEASDEEIIRLARTIVEYENSLGEKSPVTQRYFASFTQVSPSENKSELVQKFIAKMENLANLAAHQADELKKARTELQEEDKFLSSIQLQQLEVFESQKGLLLAASTIVKRNSQLFQQGKSPLDQASVLKALNSKPIPQSKFQKLELGGRNPFVAALTIDWNKDEIQIVLEEDVAKMRSSAPQTELEALQLEKLNQFLFNAIALVARNADESITPAAAGFVVKLNQLTGSSSLLVLDFGKIAQAQINSLFGVVSNGWEGKSQELDKNHFPVYTWQNFVRLQPLEQKFGLVLYAPSTEDNTEEGFRDSSLYVIARGLESMRHKYQTLEPSTQKKAFDKDFLALQELMRQNGFIGYPASSSNLAAKYHDDYIFELDDYYSYLLAATRENFSVKGNKKQAVLEFTDVEQRILTLNKIETSIHEDLLKWRDEYAQARVNLNPAVRYDVPAPTQSAFWSNVKLSMKKYFRGDERKILKWGLDLSGGKTVRIGLKDQSNQPIMGEDAIDQAATELYQRVNRLGVSEVGLRKEGNSIVLDFPGSQGLSAAELVQASAMYFHVVNEKFTAQNPLLAEAVNTFLEEVWNEAVITNRTDAQSLNEIAWHHLGGNPENPTEFNPTSSHARQLYDQGLRFAGPKAGPRLNSFDDTLSAVTLFRGADFNEWQGQTYPLLIIFRNYALEGANLADVQTGYDPSEGNMLHFSVKGSYTNHAGEKVYPREEFYAWTSKFSEEGIVNTPLATFSQGRGWRMAVVLNESVISAPTLNSALRDSARISGHFTQREINQLAADLKAGSLSFTPYILSEENVSPDLGKEQRLQGILAACIGLILVIVAMCLYYRFGGMVASVALIVNLLIIWGVLQNLGAALTLPGIAGVILALGMAVDANVLVFERIREEFAKTKRLPSAVQAGYKKAFSAIVDSNLTTIIAAVILLNFDSGPVKGLALTLIIGIISSMFTALFMTRYFFAAWVQNPQHKELKMMRLFNQTSFDFLKKARFSVIVSLVIICLGLVFLVKERSSILGMDFTGGYSLNVELKERPDTDYRLAATTALTHAGASKGDFHIQELNRPNQLRIQLAASMQEAGHPFFAIDEQQVVKNPLFAFQENPRIVWIVDALAAEGLELNSSTLSELNLHWNAMSGQFSKKMRNEALFGLGLALIAILIYITFRFEFKYAISATIGLVHDIIITLGLLALFHSIFENVRIDLQVIAALMTIVGYSLNDTIIIFDRVREEIKHMRKQSFREIINHALNATLGRTLMTSSTTLLVLLALVIFGGASIFNFALIMTIGVAIGTFSSLFIAAPLLLYFHEREAGNGQESASKLSGK